MSTCACYNPDNVFGRFKLVEFPMTFVELSTKQILDVELDLTTSAYLKTLCEGRIIKFDDAREISPSHRAFNIVQLNNHFIEITFHPKNECIAKAKRSKSLNNRFVFDLRLIQVNDVRCCNNELHAEIGRFYISGQYEYCRISHQPNVVDFGEVIINDKVTKYVRIRNESNLSANICFERHSGFSVLPEMFTIPPNSSIRLSVSVRPASLKVSTTLKFKIRNPYGELDENYITYTISSKINIQYNKTKKIVVVESLHTLYDQLPEYTYIDKELEIYNARRAIATKNFNIIRQNTNTKKPSKEKFTTGRDKCYTDMLLSKPNDGNFCNVVEPKASAYDLFDIVFLPFSVNFGKVALKTYGKEMLTIENNTKYKISVRLCRANNILYTEQKLCTTEFKLEPLKQTRVTLFCLGFVEGKIEGLFEYLIDDMFKLKYMYSLEVDHPSLMVIEKNLKFGMVTSESFITSVPIRIHNEYHEPAHFVWTDIHAETPFEIIPMSGSIPGKSCKICDAMYVCKPTKTKSHEVEFISNNLNTKLELSIVTRKLSIKFLQPAVVFKEIPLNLKTVESVKLENSSREIALFYVIEPLIPGLTIEPMNGTIRPKMIMTFHITVQIPCVIEFAFDIYFKINNKENLVLPISGVVVEPKVTIQPKNIYMPRIPCLMITYVPVTFQNTSGLRTVVEVLDTGDDNIFDVFVAHGNEKKRIFEFTIEAQQSKTVFIKVYDIFRREYDIYIPFKINRLLGPPEEHKTASTELQYFIGKYEQYYENNAKIKVKSINKDISFCRIMGVITVPWLKFSVDKFEFKFKQHGPNTIEFTVTNVSKYYLYITILTMKLNPNFSLELITVDSTSTINETQMKFELAQSQEVEMCAKFHPKYHGKFVTTALLFLDKHMTVPYSNLTLYGKRETVTLIPSTYRIIFPPCYVGTILTRFITIKLEGVYELDEFSWVIKDLRDNCLSIKFINHVVEEKHSQPYTIITVELKIITEVPYTGVIMIDFRHETQSGCDVEVRFCATYCPLTLHANAHIETNNNPYPYYPLSTHTDAYEYLEKCCAFLEKWMFLQGFRRDLYPIVPDTFHAISTALSSQGVAKIGGKGINVSYLNFIRRIAGPLMKHLRREPTEGVDESFKIVNEIHDTYRSLVNLLHSRGANLWALQPKYLLNHEQFALYSDFVTPKCNADIAITKELLSDIDLYKRLNKQSWIDFILQSYKVFVMDSCFFECVCISTKPRDIIHILIEWYNEQIALARQQIFQGKNLPVKQIKNITTDLSDGVALASAIANNCPFLKQHFSLFCEVTEENKEGDIVNNACLIIEAMNQLRLNFPLSSTDFFEPNFLQMLFFSVHLFIVLPMFKPKGTIILNPPLLRSSTRHVSICPSNQETLIFSYMILNNNRNAFAVEKLATTENGKKIFLSVRYLANFVDKEESLLLVHGYNKTRIFDTYVVFILQGEIGSLSPERKCKVTGPLYRPNKVDIVVGSPFQNPALFNIYITDTEPTVPVHFLDCNKPCFYVRRLCLIDKEIYLSGSPKDTGDVIEHKLYLQMICLSTQVGNSWIWFKSDIGQFFIRITSQPRWDLAIDTIQVKVLSWPMDPCSCGESCECYRTSFLKIPHRNELMLKALRNALFEHASTAMMNIFDTLIDTTTGKLILAMLLEEGGTNMAELEHILRSHTNYRITARALVPCVERATLAQHTNAELTIPVTIPPNDKTERYTITFTSSCGMDIRTYRIVFIETKDAA